MEYFGLASGSSKTGPSFPYMPETVLNSYPNALLEHPVVPTAVGFLNTYMQTPDARNLISVVQTWADKSLQLLEKPTVQAAGIGLSASICAYGAWRIRRRWRNNTVTSNNEYFPAIDCSEPYVKESIFDTEVPVHSVGSLDVDSSDPNTDLTQRQLLDTRAKLDDLRYQLNRLEGEKDMLAAEVSMRKKIVAQLQGEINFERDKRQQAELRMEMMEWENTHLRRLRKDVAVKEGKIDMLEASLKEKDVIHDKLFQENVILPKSVAEARAKEYEVLHTKVQKYEMDAVMKRNSEAPYKPSRHESLTSTADGTRYNDTTETMDTAVQQQRHIEPGSSESFQPSDWDKSPSSVGSAFQPIIYATNMTKNLFCSTTNWSNSKDKTQGDVKALWHMCQNEESKGSCSELVKDNGWKGVGMRAKSKKLTQQNIPREPDNKLESNQRLNRSSRKAMCATWSEISSQPLCSTEDEPGVLGQIRSFFSGFSQSGSELGLAATAHTPAQMADVLPSQSRLWDRSFEDKANNCCQEDDEDDASCPSESDGQSSIFMSASCGSDPSDNDTRDVSRSCHKSKARRQSHKRTASSAKAKTLKRTVSPVKNVSSKRDTSKKTPTSSIKKSDLEKGPSLYRVPSSNLRFVSEKASLHENVLLCNQMAVRDPATSETKAEENKGTPRQSRTRQRCRPRKSRSKLTTNTNTSKCTPSLTKTQPSDALSPTQSEKCEAMLPSHAPVDKVNQTTNKVKTTDANRNVTHSRQTLMQVCGNHAAHSVGDTNKNSADATDADSEESWIVITPAK